MPSACACAGADNYVRSLFAPFDHPLGLRKQSPNSPSSRFRKKTGIHYTHPSFDLYVAVAELDAKRELSKQADSINGSRITFGFRDDARGGILPLSFSFYFELIHFFTIVSHHLTFQPRRN